MLLFLVSAISLSVSALHVPEYGQSEQTVTLFRRATRKEPLPPDWYPFEEVKTSDARLHRVEYDALRDLVYDNKQRKKLTVLPIQHELCYGVQRVYGDDSRYVFQCNKKGYVTWMYC